MLQVIWSSLGFLGGLAFIIYLAHLLVYSPSIIVRVSGEQSGEPITLSKSGKISFAITTPSEHKSFINEVRVSFSPAQVDLFKTEGIKKEITVDKYLPFAAYFSDRHVVVKNHLQGNYLDYETKTSEFILKFTVLSEIDQTELPVIIDMFPPRKIKTERFVKFRVSENFKQNLSTSGLTLKPGEVMSTEGVQSQAGLYCATATGTAQLNILEITDDTENSP